jgi:FkbH-like protein
MRRGEKKMNKTKEIKCVIWDLDNTIWDGTLLESDDVRIKDGIIDFIIELDSRGILHSIASKNNYDEAMAKLREFGIDEYFLYPEIHFNAKSTSVANIQKNLNIGFDTFIFIDDQIFERDEVNFAHPAVECVEALEYKKLFLYHRLQPRFITEDSKRRRLMYLEDQKRNENEKSYQGPSEQFLAELKMKFTIAKAQETDLKRAEELTIRTHQLNATGVTYDYEQLKKLMVSDRHKLYICELTDKYGSYGKIGLALLEINEQHWHLKLLLMSCRVMTRGVGTVLLSYIMNEAKKAGKKLLADFKKTDRNRHMYVTYKFSNFKEVGAEDNGLILLENDLSSIQPYPPYLTLELQTAG